MSWDCTHYMSTSLHPHLHCLLCPCLAGTVTSLSHAVIYYAQNKTIKTQLMQPQHQRVSSVSVNRLTLVLWPTSWETLLLEHIFTVNTTFAIYHFLTDQQSWFVWSWVQRRTFCTCFSVRENQKTHINPTQTEKTCRLHPLVRCEYNPCESFGRDLHTVCLSTLNCYIK